MAPKRSGSSTGGNSPKKAKVNPGQTSLHSFFQPTKGNQRHGLTNFEEQSQTEQGSSRNGPDKTSAISLESRSQGRSHPRHARTNWTPSEDEQQIIDVDKLDDPGTSQGVLYAF